MTMNSFLPFMHLIYDYNKCSLALSFFPLSTVDADSTVHSMLPLENGVECNVAQLELD